jgi:flavin-dependent dehydrogenase
MIEAKAIIVGGGPAGSTCAWKLKQAAVDTIILEKEEFPRTKLCAGWITPKVARDLRLDFNTYPHGFLSFDRLHIYIRGRKFSVRTRQYSIRRYEFDNWLLKKNIQKDHEYYIIDDTFRCKYLLGAGGTNCPVYQTFFKDVNPRDRDLLITSMELEFPYQIQDKNCYLWFFERNLSGYSWYVPKSDHYLNLGIGGKLAVIKSRGETIRDSWNQFIQKLADLSLVNDYTFKPKAYNYYLRQRVRQARLDNVFILGDAAGLATKDMGEGIGPAVESGILAANAIINHTKYSLNSITKYSVLNILLPWRYKSV